MKATLIISIITCLLLILSILFFPKIKIFKKQINTYWLICLIGAIFILIKANTYVREMLGGISSDIGMGFGSFKSMLMK